jgi:O-antigen ligase
MLLGATVFGPAGRTLFVLIIGVGVFTTFSRFGLMAYGLGVMGLLFYRLIGTKSLLFTVSSATLVCTIAIATLNLDTFFAGWDQEGLVTSSGIVKGIEERMSWFSEPATSDAAMTERMEGAEQAWQLFAERPFFGGGTGTNFDVWSIADEFRKPGPHNIYLWLIVDHGIIGALIIPALLLAVAWRADGQTKQLVIITSFIILLLGFSSHNLLDGRHVLFSLGALVSMVAQDKIARSEYGESLASGMEP